MQWDNTEYDTLLSSHSAPSYLPPTEGAAAQLLVLHPEVLQQDSPDSSVFKE